MTAGILATFLGGLPYVPIEVGGRALTIFEFYTLLALLLSLVALLIYLLRWRSQYRRTRSGIRMVTEAARSLADGGEYSAVSLFRDPELATLGEAFNRINDVIESETIRFSEAENELQRRRQIETQLYAGMNRLSALTQGEALHAAVGEILCEIFGAHRVRLWLLHRFVSGGVDRLREAERAEGAVGRDGETLNKFGLLLASEQARGDLRNAELNLDLSRRGVVEVAMSYREVVCPSIGESTIFRGSTAQLIDSDLNSYAGLPLGVQSRMIGVLELFTDRPLSEVEINSLRLFAFSAANLITAVHGGEEMAQTREAEEMKQLELQMAYRRLQRTNAQLAEADRLKSEFLANTSHELRTPLNSILGFAQLILAGACDSEDELKANVTAIHESGTRLLKLINEVLDLAKIEAGRFSLNLESLDVRPVIDAVRTLLNVQAEARGIKIHLDIPEFETPAIRADHSKVYQILLNMIGNAVKFTEEGSVTIRVVSEKIPGFLSIEVQDTGIGISAEVASRLFQNFVQGDGSVTRKFGGTGLGLAISQKMADMQGGALSLTSQGEGCGALATLTLPLWSDLMEAEWATMEGSARASLKVPDRTVVVIEDYLEFQRYLVDILQDRGWSALPARTAKEGLELIQEHAPAAIILDMHLPWDENDTSVRTGYDLVNLLGRDRELNRIPILIVTGMLKKSADRLLSQTILNPLELYGKPLDEDAFFESLDRLTSNQKRASAVVP